MSRPIKTATALAYLLGFHCSGARISEPQEAAPYGFDITYDVSESEVAGTADPDSIHSVQGGTNGPSSSGTESFITYPPSNSKDVTYLTRTYDWVSDTEVNIDIAGSYNDNSIGLAATAAITDILNMSPPAQYSGNKRNSVGFYDCSSLVARAYHTALTNLGITDNYFVTNDGPLNTEGLAKFLNNHNCLLYINDPNKTDMLHGMLPGDIIIRSKHYASASDSLGTRSKYKYETAHALMYVGNGKTIDILTRDGNDVKQTDFSLGGESFYSGTSRVRFIGRPSLFYNSLKGISIPDSHLIKNDWGTLTTAPDYSYAVSSSLIPA